MRNALLLLVLLGIIIFFPTKKEFIKYTKPLAAEDYKIYSAFINEFEFYKNVPSAGMIIADSMTNEVLRAIDSTTTWAWTIGNLGDRCRYLCDTIRCRKAEEPGWATLFEQLKQLPRTERIALQLPRFMVNDSLQLLSRFRKQRAADPFDSISYYIFNVSRIVYNKPKTKALFFGTFVCGGTCGRGELVMVEKVGNNWTLIDTFRFWIA